MVLLSRNCYEYGVNTFGAVLAGAVLVTMNQKKTWDELSWELELSLIHISSIPYSLFLGRVQHSGLLCIRCAAHRALVRHCAQMKTKTGHSA